MMARRPLRIRTNARPGDAQRLRLLLQLPEGRPCTTPRFRGVIYKPERHGDLFLAANAIRTLAEHWGQDRTGLIVSPACHDLARLLFPDLPTFSLPLALRFGGWDVGQALKLRRALSDWSCEHLVCLRHHRKPLSSAALRWIPAASRWGTTGHPWVLPAIEASEAGLFDQPVSYPWPGQEGVPVEIQAHALMVGHITGDVTSASPLFPEVEIPVQDGGRRGPPTLVLVPWGSGGRKTLTRELMAGVLEHLPDLSRCAVRIVAERRRRGEQARLIRQLRFALPGVDVAPEPSGGLRELYATIGRATAVMTADTFPAHLATAMDKPVAVLATGAQRGVFGPWSRSHRQRWFCREMDCWGCGWRCPYPEPRCLLEIEKKAVAAFLAPYLAGDR